MKAKSKITQAQTIEDLFDALKKAEQIVSAIGCPPLTRVDDIQTLFIANKLGHQVVSNWRGQQTITADGLLCKYLFKSSSQQRFQLGGITDKDAVNRIVSRFKDAKGGIYFAVCDGIISFRPIVIKLPPEKMIEEIKRQLGELKFVKGTSLDYRRNISIGDVFLQKSGEEINLTDLV